MRKQFIKRIHSPNRPTRNNGEIFKLYVTVLGKRRKRFKYTMGRSETVTSRFSYARLELSGTTYIMKKIKVRRLGNGEQTTNQLIFMEDLK